jgi:ABC-2 type transport system ATP-binding protein
LTVILTTHYIEEAEMLCGRIGFIDRGQLIRLDTPENLIKENGNYVLEAFDANETRRYFFPNREDALLFAAGLTGEVHIREANLEDAFLNLTNRKVEE